MLLGVHLAIIVWERRKKCACFIKISLVSGWKYHISFICMLPMSDEFFSWGDQYLWTRNKLCQSNAVHAGCILQNCDLLIKVQRADQVALLSLGSGLEMTNSAAWTDMFTVQMQWLFSQGTVRKKVKERDQSSSLSPLDQQLLANRTFEVILEILAYRRHWMMKKSRAARSVIW